MLVLDALIVDGGSDATAFAIASASAVDGEAICCVCKTIEQAFINHKNYNLPSQLDRWNQNYC